MLNFTGELCGYIYITPTNSFMYYCVICEDNFESSKEFQNHNLNLHFQLTNSEQNNDVDFKDIQISSSNSQNFKNSKNFDHDLSDDAENSLNIISKELHVEIQKVELNERENELYNKTCSSRSTPSMEYDTENEEKYTIFLDQSVLEQKPSEMYNKKSSNLFPYGLDDLDEVNLQCKYCKKQFSKKLNLIEHTKNHLNYILTCKVCGKHSYRRSHAEAHEKTHVKMKSTITDTNFLNENELEAHIKRHGKKSDIQNNLKTNNDEKISKCDFCFAVFPCNKNLQNHIISHHAEDMKNIFSCELCGKIFNTNDLRDSHIKKIHKIDKLPQCETCGRLFESLNDLKRHKLKHHTKKQKMAQSVEGNDNLDYKNILILSTNSEEMEDTKYNHRTYEEKISVQDHLLKSETNFLNFEIEKINNSDKENKVKHEVKDISLSSSPSVGFETENESSELEIDQSASSLFPYGVNDIGETDHKCKYCFKPFTTKFNLIQHTKEHLNFILTCKVCGKHSSRKSHALSHEKIHKKEKCCLCDASFSNEKALEKHMKRHEMLRCQFCSKEFKKFDALHNHLRTHTGEKPFKCDVCSAAFAIKRNLQTHTVTQHTGDIKNFSCKFCDRRFKTKQLEDWHTKRVHLKEKPHVCEICGLNFANMSGLRRHKLKRHTEYNKRPHPCQLCDKRFVELKNLTEHMNTHTGEKPFQCDICSKSFGQQSSLREHKKLHTGKKTHICKICGKAFAQHSGCSNHMKQHHMISNNN